MTSQRSLDGAHVLILGGTGSLGQRLVNRLLTNEAGVPATITVFSRDEAKQHYMRLAFQRAVVATDEIIYSDATRRLRFAIGDVRHYHDVRRNVDGADVIFHAAALKQVPTCEYFAGAAVDTNIYGALNVVRALREGIRGEKHVIGISTDKACKPVNVMGMTKALQERVFIQANLDVPASRFVNVRYGNVMASRGSAIPFFISVARDRHPIPITDERMTRFLMTLNQSVDLILNAFRRANAGETFLPIVPCARVVDVARAVAENDDYPLVMTGIRPGEKVHEILVSEEEVSRTERRSGEVVILPILPEIRVASREGVSRLTGEFSSADDNLKLPEVHALLRINGLTVSTAPLGQEIYK